MAVKRLVQHIGVGPEVGLSLVKGHLPDGRIGISGRPTASVLTEKERCDIIKFLGGRV